MKSSHNLVKEPKIHANQIGQQIANCLKNRNKKNMSGIPKIKDKQGAVMEVVICHPKTIDL